MHGFPPPAACQAAEAQARWTAAMRAGDFATAWAIGDAVLAASDPAARDDPRLPYHLRRVWDATPPDGRDVLVRCYHGLGDVLMAARLLPMLRDAGADGGAGDAAAAAPVARRDGRSADPVRSDGARHALGVRH